jgi:4-hydroxy-tetrahydrodipicolinate reductase
MRACLANGAKMVVGTTGWYDKLADMRSLAQRRGGALLYGTNFSLGVQIMLELSRQMATALKDKGYTFSVSETHHTSKLDSPSGTALTLRDAVLSSLTHSAGGQNMEVQVHSTRSGDVAGVHTLEALGASDRLLITHESTSRRPFAEGAVRAAEWLSTRAGVYDIRDVFDKL